MHNDHAQCNNVLRLVAASLFTIFISTCTMINFKLVVSKNEIKQKNNHFGSRKIRRRKIRRKSSNLTLTLT